MFHIDDQKTERPITARELFPRIAPLSIEEQIDEKIEILAYFVQEELPQRDGPVVSDEWNQLMRLAAYVAEHGNEKQHHNFLTFIGIIVLQEPNYALAHCREIQRHFSEIRSITREAAHRAPSP